MRVQIRFEIGLIFVFFTIKKEYNKKNITKNKGIILNFFLARISFLSQGICVYAVKFSASFV